MSEPSGPVIVRFCLALSLAVALVSIGVFICLDFWLLNAPVNGRISLIPGAGLLSVLVGTSLLMLLFRLDYIATVLACLTSVVALCQAALPLTPADEILQMFVISNPLLVATLLTEFSILFAIHHSTGWIAGLIAGPVVVAAGLFSLFSFWFPSLAIFDLGSVPESTIIVSSLGILAGLVLPFLHTIHSRAAPDFSIGVLLVGVFGVVLTTVTWHTMHIYSSNGLQDRAEGLAEQLQASSTAAFNADLALIRRLAERQPPMTGLPIDTDWAQEVQSYLNDFRKIQLVGILDPHHQLVSVQSRPGQYQDWLEQFLQDPDNRTWLNHVGETGLPHLSAPQPDARGRMFAVIASPIPAPTGPPWVAIAVLDLEVAYNSLLQHYDGGLSPRIYYGRRLIFDPAPDTSRGARVRLAVRNIDVHHDSQWRIEVYTRKAGLPANAWYLPPLILFTGLILSFLMIISHLLWRESERRSNSLIKLNRMVNTHLSQEQLLRHTNERIMEFSRDILCSIDAKGLFTFINPAAQTILGYRPDQLIGQPYNILIPDADREPTAEEVHILMSGERRTSYGFRNQQRHLNGHLVELSWTAEWSNEDQTLFCVGRDMGDQLMAELLMREREQFFSLSPDMFCIVDLESHFFELNKAFVDVLGYEREELLGASYMQLIHEADQAKVVEAVKSLRAGNTIRDLHIRVNSKNNTEHWLELSATLSSDELIYVAARDTTEMRHTQEKLRESETLLKIAEKAARIGGWVMNASTGKTRWSNVMFDIFEMPVGEAPCLKQASKFYTSDHHKIIANAVDACITTGAPFDEEVQICTQLDRLRWVRVIGQAIKDGNDRVIQVQGGLQDITASHQAMEQIRLFTKRQAHIFESITDAFFTLDPEWRFTYVNQRSEEILRKRRDELLGNTLWNMFPTTLDSEFERQYRYAMGSGESVSFEVYSTPLDKWLEVSAYPSDEGLAVYYRSINERKQAQEKLEQTMIELERSNRDLQDFAFVASHDLQEPLRKIQAFSNRLLIRSDQFDEQEQDYLQRMQSAAKRMQSLILDLLTYSRVMSQTRPMVSCNTNQILADVLQDMETVILQENALIDTRPLPEIFGDATQIRQMLQNLLSNAIKFHKPDKNPQVSVYADSAREQGWTLVVSDNGVGFDKRYSGKLFHPFQRLHTHVFPGTGIGLAIVKKILDRHGATVSVESEVDRGASFRIHFPASRQTEEKRND